MGMPHSVISTTSEWHCSSDSVMTGSQKPLKPAVSHRSRFGRTRSYCVVTVHIAEAPLTSRTSGQQAPERTFDLNATNHRCQSAQPSLNL